MKLLNPADGECEAGRLSSWEGMGWSEGTGELVGLEAWVMRIFGGKLRRICLLCERNAVRGVEETCASPGCGKVHGVTISSCLGLRESRYGGSVPAVPGNMSRKYWIWPLMLRLLSGEVWTASCLALVGAAFEYSPALSWGLLILSINGHHCSVLTHLLRSVIQSSYLLERIYILSWNVKILLLWVFLVPKCLAVGRVTSVPPYFKGTVISAGREMFLTIVSILLQFQQYVL